MGIEAAIHPEFSVRQRSTVCDHCRMSVEREALTDNAHRVGATEIAVASIGDATLMRERMDPGWRWSVDLQPIVGTDRCRAHHQMYVVSGRLNVVMEDGSEVELVPGDAAGVPPGHDAFVVGDEPCEIIDLSPTYRQLLAAGEAYRAMTDPNATRRPVSMAQAAVSLRTDARRGRLDPEAVELVLGSAGARPRRQSGPAGLTGRELEVLVLIATGSSAKQVAHALGIALKTATTHIERIYVKCGVSTRAEATHFAIANGLIRALLPNEAREVRLTLSARREQGR